MRDTNKLNHVLKGVLSIGTVVAGMEIAQAAQRPTIDPMTFCSNSCNDRCNTGDPLAPKLKAQCKKMCSDQMDQVASLQMSKMTGDKGKEFRQARGQAKVDMLKDAPIYRCLSETAAAAPEEATPVPMRKPIPKLETMSVAQMASAQRAAAMKKPAVITDTRSAAQKESDENYERSLKAAAVQEPAEAEGQGDVSQDLNQDIQNLKEAIGDISAKLDALGEKINSTQVQ